jgi:RNA polymerase sigma-70 factor (ECF subfamily)
VEALGVTMTKNLCLDKLRSYKNRKQNDEEVETLTLHSGSPDPAQETELTESLKTIHTIFETLPEQQKLINHLRDVEQYEYEEISDMTGLAVNNIRVNLSRARKAVREEYLKHQNYEHRKN